MIYKYCKCGKKIEDSINCCSDCQGEIDKAKKEQYRQYQSSRADVREQKFYNSSKWKTVRDVARARDKWLCRLCLSDSLISEADVVHHIVEIKKDWDKRLDLDNVICLCNCCHKEVHIIYDKGSKNRQEMIMILKDILDLEFKIG